MARQLGFAALAVVPSYDVYEVTDGHGRILVPLPLLCPALSAEPVSPGAIRWWPRTVALLAVVAGILAGRDRRLSDRPACPRAAARADRERQQKLPQLPQWVTPQLSL